MRRFYVNNIPSLQFSIATRTAHRHFAQSSSAVALLGFCGMLLHSRRPALVGRWLVGHAGRLLVAAADGYLYVYNVDTNEGGDCNLIKQHRSVAAGQTVT